MWLPISIDPGIPTTIKTMGVNKNPKTTIANNIRVKNHWNWVNHYWEMVVEARGWYIRPVQASKVNGHSDLTSLGADGMGG